MEKTLEQAPGHNWAPVSSTPSLSSWLQSPHTPLPPLSLLFGGREQLTWRGATESKQLFPRLALLHQREHKGTLQVQAGCRGSWSPSDSQTGTS